MNGEKLLITFRDRNDIMHFVATCCKYDDAIDIMLDRQVTDAKSVMGMLLLPLGQPMEIAYDCYDEERDGYEEFRQEILQEYNVQAVPAVNPPLS